MSIFGVPEKLVNRALQTFDLVDATIRDIRTTVNNINGLITQARTFFTAFNAASSASHTVEPLLRK